MARPVLPEAPFDHVILLVPDIVQGVADFRATSGVEPAIGGRHPEHETVNALASTGDGYVELIAIDRPGAGGAAPRVIGFAVQTKEIETVAAAAKAAGFATDIVDGQRQTPEGTLLRWRALEVVGHDFAGAMPFFIDWGVTPHPSTTSPGGLTEAQLTAVHPRAFELQALYRSLGIGINVETGSAAELRFEVMTPRGKLAFSGDDIGWRAALAQAVAAA